MKMNYNLLLPLFLILPFAIKAQTGGFSEGKNLFELTRAVYEKAHIPAGMSFFFQELVIPPTVTPIHTKSPVFLPKWSVEALPFFCKIEHKWEKKSRIPFKFRLGSVEYVDWLEGK